jgi:hypothetical protein
MADVLITATEETDLSRNHARSLSKINPALGNVGSDQIRPIEYFVGLYSVNKRRMAESPYSFIVENGAFKQVAIPACPADKRYIKVMAIPHPVQSIEADPHAMGETVVRITSAGRVAMSIVHPDIIGDNMNHLPPQSALAKHAISSNCDLVKQGVFFTTADEGSKEFEKYLLAAEGRLEAYYRALVDGVQGMSEDEIRRVLSSERGLDLRTAAEHLGEEYSWLRSRTPKVPCPNCFEKVPKGAAFHKNELLGVICVIDWQRAVEAGVKTIDDVPPSKRWWDEDEDEIEDADFEEPNTGDARFAEPSPEEVFQNTAAKVQDQARRMDHITQVRRGPGRPFSKKKLKKTAAKNSAA